MEKPREEFSIKLNGAARQADCKECHRAWARRHYAANKPYYLNKNAKARQRKRAFLTKAKERPCADCGQIYPHYVMEFDHVGEKRWSIARMTTNTWRQIADELKKCEVVCANCHAARTWHRRRTRDVQTKSMMSPP